MNIIRKIKNWLEFQHYHTGKNVKCRPEWIKLYHKLLEDIEWHNLDPFAAKTLVSLWLLASENGGVLPSIHVIAFRLRMEESQIRAVLSQLPHWIEDDGPDLPRKEVEVFPRKEVAVCPRPDREEDNKIEVEEDRELEEREIGAKAPAAGWHGTVIHLNAKDYAEWIKAYSHLDLPAELLAYDQFLGEQSPAVVKWFPRTSKYLANRNMEAKAKGEIAARPPPERLTRTAAASQRIEEQLKDGRFGVPDLCTERREVSVVLLPEPGTRPRDVSEAAHHPVYGAAKIAFAKDG